MQSFYGVYSTLFEKLARQEAEAFKNRDDIDEDSRRDCPSFPRCEGAGGVVGVWGERVCRSRGNMPGCVCPIDHLIMRYFNGF